MKRDFRSNVLLFTPGYLIYAVIILVPVVLSFYYSFYDWNGMNKDLTFLGLDNFQKALTDSRFHSALYITAFIAVAGTLLTNVFGLFFAILLNKQGRMTKFYRFVFFFPVLLSAVIVGFLWKPLLNYVGLVNTLLEQMNVSKINFFGDPDLAILTITAIIIWQSTGAAIIIYLAGLQSIPADLYEAANIDGASRWQKFTNVTFPMLAPAVTIVIIFNFTALAREYDRIAVLTYGGPARSTETIAYTVVDIAFTANRFSYASSMAVITLIIVGILSVVMTIYLRKREERII